MKKKNSKEHYLSFCGKGNGVVGATGHFGNPLVLQVGGDQGGDQPVDAGPVAQLTVAVVAPCVHLALYAERKVSFFQPASCH